MMKMKNFLLLAALTLSLSSCETPSSGGGGWSSINGLPNVGWQWITPAGFAPNVGFKNFGSNIVAFTYVVAADAGVHSFSAPYKDNQGRVYLMPGQEWGSPSISSLWNINNVYLSVNDIESPPLLSAGNWYLKIDGEYGFPTHNSTASESSYADTSAGSSSGGSSYSGGSGPNVGAQVMQNYNRAFNTGITGLYSVAPQITVNPYNHSAQLPITVAYRKNGPTGSYSMEFFIKSDDDTRPLTGTATMFIGENDPPVGEKTVNMWIQASRSTNATISVLGHTGGFSIEGYGQHDHTEVDVP
jgi:hypothetical protein